MDRARAHLYVPRKGEDHIAHFTPLGADGPAPADLPTVDTRRGSGPRHADATGTLEHRTVLRTSAGPFFMGAFAIAAE